MASRSSVVAVRMETIRLAAGSGRAAYMRSSAQHFGGRLTAQRDCMPLKKRHAATHGASKSVRARVVCAPHYARALPLAARHYGTGAAECQARWFRRPRRCAAYSRFAVAQLRRPRVPRRARALPSLLSLPQEATAGVIKPWKAVWDAASSDFYYWHPSGEVSWIKPTNSEVRRRVVCGRWRAATITPRPTAPARRARAAAAAAAAARRR